MLLKPRPPFDLSLTASVFSEGDRQIRRYENGRYWQVIRVGGKLILVVATSSGTADKPELEVELKSPQVMSDTDQQEACEIISRIFGLGLDLAEFYREIASDRVISRLVPELTGLRITTTATIFEALVHAVIQQQISLNVSRNIERNLVKTFGEALELEGELYYVFPSPQELASATIEQIHECGLSLKKAEYISEIARLVVSGKLDLNKYKAYEDAGEIIRELDELKGVGTWTAELTLLRGMQRLDVVPADDLAVRRVISHYYSGNARVSSREVRRIAEGWGRWKGLAVFYLIIADRLGL